MVMRVAINGFGRIGRQVFEAGLDCSSIEFVAINDLTSPDSLAYLLKYDSVHGKRKESISYDEKNIIVNGKKIPVFSEKEPEKLPWKDLNVDIVAECTGLYTDGKLAMKHIVAGAKKVLISAPGKNMDITLIKGVNEHLYDKNKHNIISNGSCTTNCLAPLVKVLNDNYTVKRGFMTTTHAYTADQRLVDAPHKDFRRGRSAALSLIPTTTGAASTVAEVIPSLKGKLNGLAIRAPVPDGSIVVFTCEVEKPTSKEELNNLFKNVSESHLKGILEYSYDPIVSADVIHNQHSVIFDPEFTDVLEKTMVTVTGWYDNEWGYSNRMIDVIKLLL